VYVTIAFLTFLKKDFESLDLQSVSTFDTLCQQWISTLEQHVVVITEIDND